MRDNTQPENPEKLDGIMMGNLRITLHRTCRVPHGKMNSLPASLGHFPLYRVMDFKQSVPVNWKIQEGAYFMPIYKHEAMWIGFRNSDQPIALMVGAGMVNAITGEKLADSLTQTPEQNYLIPGHQPWLDGFKMKVGGKVCQFVSANLGDGETAEEQILHTAEFGGLQFAAFKVKPGVKLTRLSRPAEHVSSGGFYPLSFGSVTRGVAKGFSSGSKVQEMGLGVGGEISQKIYPDPYTTEHSLDKIWDSSPFMKTYIYMVDAESFKRITGMKAPASPITYNTYQELGLPWFGLFDGQLGDTPGSEVFDKLNKVGGAPQLVTIAGDMGKPEEEQTEENIIGIQKSAEPQAFKSVSGETAGKDTLKLW